MSVIKNILTGGVDKTLEAVKGVITTFVPDKGLQQQLNAEIDKQAHGLKIRQLESADKAIQAEITDRANAREMYRDTSRNEDVFIRRFPMLLAFGALILSATMLVAMLFVSIPDHNRDIVNISLGTLLGGSLGSVFNFFFGSSYEDKHKK